MDLKDEKETLDEFLVTFFMIFFLTDANEKIGSVLIILFKFTSYALECNVT